MQHIFEKYKDYLLYNDQNIYVFENSIKDYTLTITLNYHDVIIQFNNLKFKIPECFQYREEIFKSFVLGNYCIKKYFLNDKLLSYKLVWDNNNLKKFKSKSNVTFFKCEKFNHIEEIEGVIW